MLGVGTQDIRDEDCSVLRRTGMSRLGRGSLRPALERDGPDDHLVVDGSQGSANEGADPEDPMVAPGVLPVVDDGSAKAPSWVDASASNGDGGKVDQEHREPNWQWGKDRNMGVPGVPLGISG